MPQLPHPDSALAPWIRAHRDAQSDQRAAVAAEHARDLAAAQQRLTAIDTRLRALGHSSLADQLTAETRAGTALIVALTCPAELATDELAGAIATYTHHRSGVDATRTRSHPGAVPA